MMPNIKGLPEEPKKPRTVNRFKGISFIEGLQLLFIAFQLAGIINWSWFLVMSPLIFKFLAQWAINAIEERNRTKRG